MASLPFDLERPSVRFRVRVPASEDLQQGRFARAIAADKTDAIFGMNQCPHQAILGCCPARFPMRSISGMVCFAWFSPTIGGRS